MNRALPALLHREGLEPESWLEPVDEKDGWAAAWPTSEVRRAVMNGDAKPAPASRVSALYQRPSRRALVEPLFEPGIASIVIPATLPEPA